MWILLCISLLPLLEKVEFSTKQQTSLTCVFTHGGLGSSILADGYVPFEGRLSMKLLLETGSV